MYLKLETIDKHNITENTKCYTEKNESECAFYTVQFCLRTKVILTKQLFL